MWSKIRPIIGVLLIIGVLNGTREMLTTGVNSNRDMEAIATIDSLTANKLRITRFATKTDHYIKYSFRAHDGEVYTKSYSISPSEYTSLREGQKVPVRYHSNNPSINALPSLRSYMSVSELKAVNPTSNPIVRGIMLAAFAVLGGYLIWGPLSAFLSLSGTRMRSPQVRQAPVRQSRATTGRIPNGRLTAATSSGNSRR